jgi:hypothetical protein
MNRFTVLMPVAVAFFATATLARADDKPDPRAKVETAVAEAVRLIEAKEYATLLKKFVPPDEYKRVTENVSIDEFAKKFGESKAPRMLKALKAAQGVKPTMNDDGSKATIEFKEPVEGKDKIEFIKIDKLWYIKG